MIRHIVMFKLKEFATPADKQAKMQEIKTGLEALLDKIDVLRMIRVDYVCQPSRTCSHIQRYHRSSQGRQGLRRL